MSRQPFSNQQKFVNAQNVVVSFQSSGMQMNNMDLISFHSRWTKVTDPDSTFDSPGEVSIANDTATIPSHGYLTGEKITQLTTTGTLPAGLSLSTIYYVIVVDANTIAFATSQANALAGTKVNITDAGTGTHTVDIATTLAGTIDVQCSNDNQNWIDVLDSAGASIQQTITDASGGYGFVIGNAGFEKYRVDCVVTSGRLSLAVAVHAK